MKTDEAINIRRDPFEDLRGKTTEQQSAAPQRPTRLTIGRERESAESDGAVRRDCVIQPSDPARDSLELQMRAEVIAGEMEK